MREGMVTKVTAHISENHTVTTNKQGHDLHMCVVDMHWERIKYQLLDIPNPQPSTSILTLYGQACRIIKRRKCVTSCNERAVCSIFTATIHKTNLMKTYIKMATIIYWPRRRCNSPDFQRKNCVNWICNCMERLHTRNKWQLQGMDELCWHWTWMINQYNR